MLLPAPGAQADVLINESLPLQDGQIIERNFRLEEGTTALVTLEQDGVDAILEIKPPHKTDWDAYQSPTRTFGSDTALIENARQGECMIRIRTATHGVPSGEVRLRVRSLGQPEDAGPVQGLRVRSQADHATASHDPATRLQADALYQRATTAFAGESNAAQATESRFALARLQAERGELSKALHNYAVAFDYYRARNDTIAAAHIEMSRGETLREHASIPAAIAALQQAITAFKAHGKAFEAALAHNQLCLSQHRQAALHLAESCYQDTLREFERLDAQSEQARVMNNLGGVYFMRGRTQDAAREFAQALSIWEELGLEDDALTVRNNVALTHSRLGDYQRALNLYLQNLAYAEANGLGLDAGQALNNIGYTYYNLGNLPRARDYFDRAATARRAMQARADLANTLNNLGAVQREMGDLNAAIRSHTESAGIAMELNITSTQAGALIYRARVLLDQALPAEALSALSSALSLLDQSEDKRYLDDALMWSGVAALALNDDVAARDYLARAMQTPERSHHPGARAEILYWRARLEAHQGNSDGALQLLAEGARLVETVRAEILGPELRATYLASQQRIYELNTRLLMRRHFANPEGGFARRAIENNERARARSLLEQLSASAAGISAGVNPALLQRERALRHELVALMQQHHPEDGTSADRDQALRTLTEKIEQASDAIRRQSPTFAALIYPAPLDLEGMRATLEPGVTLLQFSLGEEQSWLWALSKSALHAFVLPPRRQIEESAREFVQQVRINNPRGAKRVSALAQQFGTLLLGQAVATLGNERLIVVPDGYLHAVPFAALRIRNQKGESKALIENHEIFYAPSLTFIASQRRLPRLAASRGIAILADPVYDRGDARLGLARQSGSSEGLHARILQRLSGSAREAGNVAALFPVADTLVALGFDARRDTVVNGGLSPYRILHFATHGIVDHGSPLASGLALSGFDARGTPLPAFLSLADLYSLHLAANLVVLSACDTALGNDLRGEGMIGLTRGFLSAGAGSVLASNWQVPDAATAELMKDFYTLMQEKGAKPVAALRLTQLNFLRQPSRAMPFYWASFGLYGDWNWPVADSGSPSAQY